MALCSPLYPCSSDCITSLYCIILHLLEQKKRFDLIWKRISKKVVYPSVNDNHNVTDGQTDRIPKTILRSACYAGWRVITREQHTSWNGLSNKLVCSASIVSARRYSFRYVLRYCVAEWLPVVQRFQALYNANNYKAIHIWTYEKLSWCRQTRATRLEVSQCHLTWYHSIC